MVQGWALVQGLEPELAQELEWALEPELAPELVQHNPLPSGLLTERGL